MHTTGNEHAHAIVVADGALGAAHGALRAHGLPASPVVDCCLPTEPPAGAANGGNAVASVLDTQRELVSRVTSEIRHGRAPVLGVMLPAYLCEGRQDVLPGRKLAYGVSVGGDCFGWAETAAILERLADAVRARNAAA